MNVLIMCLGNPETLPRPKRNITYLHKKNFKIDAVCYKYTPKKDSELTENLFSNTEKRISWYIFSKILYPNSPFCLY